MHAVPYRMHALIVYRMFCCMLYHVPYRMRPLYCMYNVLYVASCATFGALEAGRVGLWLWQRQPAASSLNLLDVWAAARAAKGVRGWA